MRGKWFGLLQESWLNPAGNKKLGFANTCNLLDRARAFHEAISTTYHEQSYGHYGADQKMCAWHRVVWEIDARTHIQEVDSLRTDSDNAKGTLLMRGPSPTHPNKFDVTLLPPTDPGDQTVPVHSADAQVRCGKFKGLFRQTGYEHQKSYEDPAVVAATLYSLLRIASTMEWSSHESA